jgi:hypothetical protein
MKTWIYTQYNIQESSPQWLPNHFRGLATAILDELLLNYILKKTRSRLNLHMPIKKPSSSDTELLSNKSFHVYLLGMDQEKTRFTTVVIWSMQTSFLCTCSWIENWDFSRDEKHTNQSGAIRLSHLPSRVCGFRSRQSNLNEWLLLSTNSHSKLERTWRQFL